MGILGRNKTILNDISKKQLITWALRQAGCRANLSFVQAINFSNKLKLCAPKPALTQSPKPLACSLKHDTVNK
ncbi:hypothetical protein CHX27_03340 [Flavobacterium aurantiibacter]|uniref:Uncharacterized protein n=1 Tax=Flavobacterium aurantiibacter TaxID=2023067 RepID=A0A256A0R6_9FLAO|nr:hypothetical protein CHX27_03340 [Flavobacterium aurantiibacter]